MRMGGEGKALPAAFPLGARDAWSCCIHAGARRAGGRSERLAEAAERRGHGRAGERWEGNAAGASVSRGETQHLGAEQLHGAPRAGPAPRSRPWARSARRPPRCARPAPPRCAPRGPGPGGARAERAALTTLPSRPRRGGGFAPGTAGRCSPGACGARRAPAGLGGAGSRAGADPGGSPPGQGLEPPPPERGAPPAPSAAGPRLPLTGVLALRLCVETSQNV